MANGKRQLLLSMRMSSLDGNDDVDVNTIVALAFVMPLQAFDEYHIINARNIKKLWGGDNFEGFI